MANAIESEPAAVVTAAAAPARAVLDDGKMLTVARMLGVSRATLWAVRTEVEARWVRVRTLVWPPARRTIHALRLRSDLLVNVASGPFVADGFVNLELRRYHPDIVRWDCRRSLPVADGSCRGIRIEHFVEHLDPRDELPYLLADCRRALAPAGVLRIVVPDAARFMRAYIAGTRATLDDLGVPDPLPADLPTPLDIVNHTFHQWHEHRWAFDVQNLAWRLAAAGFGEIAASEFRSSRLPALGVADRAQHAPYSLYVECTKPAVSRR